MSRIILHKEVTKHRRTDEELDMLPRYDVVSASCDTMVRKPDNLYVIYSQKHTGENRHSGKRYWRWENQTLQGLRRNKNGNIVAYARIDKCRRNTSPSSVWAILEPTRYHNGKNHIFRENAKEMFGVGHWHDVYPVAKHYEIPQYYMVPSTLITPMRATNSREFVERLFGKRQYRKDLLKATGNSETIYPLHVAQAFRGLVPIDWIVNFLRLDHRVETGYDQGYGISIFNDLRPFLTQIDPRSYRHLLREPVTTNILYQIEDAMRVLSRDGLNNEGDNYFRSWEDVHDRVMPRYHYSRSTPFQECEIPLLPLAEKVHGLTTKSFEIVTATHTLELEEWGKTMHNCIGGYKRMAAEKNTILGAVLSNGKLVANFEISTNGNLKQLLGTCNKPLTDNQRAELEPAFKSKGVKVQGYWGRNNDLF